MDYTPTNEDSNRNEYVMSCIEMMQKNADTRIQRENKNFAIQKLMESGFLVQEPIGPRKIQSKTLMQSKWKTKSRMKLLDWQLHGSNRPEVNERLVTAGVSTTMQRGGFVSAFIDKNGMFDNALDYGDGYQLIGANPRLNDPNLPYNMYSPMLYRPVSNSNVYFDSYCTRVRGNNGMNATQSAVVFSTSIPEFKRIFPKFKDKDIRGRIPRDVNLFKEIQRTYMQSNKLDDLVEYAYFFDLAEEAMVLFAGAGCFVMDQKVGKQYPYYCQGEPYIPVSNFMCMPSSDGIYNHGLGDMLYDLAIVERRLLNMANGYVEDSAYPVTLVNLPKGEETEFFNKLSMAYNMRNSGKKAYVPVAYDPNQPNNSGVNAQSLIAQADFNAWQALRDAIAGEIKRMGINLDELDRGPDISATQILADEENSTMFVKEMMNNNSTEFEFLIKITMEMISTLVPTDADIPLDLTTKLELGNGQSGRPDNVTLGAVADELRRFHYFPRVNSRSGANPSNIMRQAQITRVLPFTPPGTPGYTKLSGQMAQLNDVDLSPEDFGVPQPGGAPVAPGDDMGAPMTETDRARINARSKTVVPV